MNDPAPTGFALEAARPDDFEALLALRLRAMRESLERIGRYDPVRARKRLAAGFDAQATHHIVVEGRRVGFVVLKRLSHVMRLDHLYIEPAEQNQGIGERVVGWVCAQADEAQMPVELCALKHSDANRFYLHQGFVRTGVGEWDIDYVRMPTGPGLATVRAFWHDLQARDWAAVRARLHDEAEVHWWTSGEHFAGPDAFVEANARYPEGWSIKLIECARLEDGRVMSLVRVDHPPRTFYATSMFQVDDGRIVGIDEYWATAEAPPDWRAAGSIAGLTRFDAQDDPRARQP